MKVVSFLILLFASCTFNEESDCINDGKIFECNDFSVSYLEFSNNRFKYNIIFYNNADSVNDIFNRLCDTIVNHFIENENIKQAEIELNSENDSKLTSIYNVLQKKYALNFKIKLRNSRIYLLKRNN